MYFENSTKCCRHTLRLQPAKWLQGYGQGSYLPRLITVDVTPRRSIQCTRSQKALSLHLRSKWNVSRRYTNTQVAKPPPWVGAAILTQNASHASVEKVLEQIEPLSTTTHFKDKSYIAVFLFSKAFALWSVEGGIFLSKAVARLCSLLKEDGHGIANIKVLAAVVDSIPAPIPLWKDRSSQTEDLSSSRSTHYQCVALDGKGSEGVAYCTFEEDSRFTLQESASRAEPFAQLGGVDISTLSICFQARDMAASVPLDVTSVTLPLASTIFSTGRAYSMFLSQWKSSPGRDLNMYQHKETTHQVVHLPVGALQKSLENVIATPMDQAQALEEVISAPLMALTAPRRIEDCVGNIVRRLKRDDETIFPASEELEAAVAAFFKEYEITPQPVSVWALVVGRQIVGNHTELLRRLREYQPGPLKGASNGYSTNFLDEFLKAGATLHRVVSGGGGWGNKAGLLSLDANSGYGPSALEAFRDNEGAPSEEAGATDFQKMFGSLALQGDYIKFFIPPMALLPAHDSEDDLSRSGYCISSIDFGVVPSTIDDIPGTASEAESKQPTLKVFRNHFGALSEGGMSIEMLRNANASHFKTKVDVPLARLSSKTILK